MATAQPKIAKCCIWLMILMVGSLAAGATPLGDERRTKLAVLDRLVGSWVFRAEEKDSFISARQECKWILNRQFLEIDTTVHQSGRPPSSWRMLLTYDPTNNCYQQWKFSENGVVSTEYGVWNEKTSLLNLSGRTLNGNDSESRVKIIDENTIQVSVREFLDKTHTRMASVLLTLSRVPPSS